MGPYGARRYRKPQTTPSTRPRHTHFRCTSMPRPGGQNHATSREALVLRTLLPRQFGGWIISLLPASDRDTGGVFPPYH
jgi:hypothetical protein